MPLIRKIFLRNQGGFTAFLQENKNSIKWWQKEECYKQYISTNETSKKWLIYQTNDLQRFFKIMLPKGTANDNICENHGCLCAPKHPVNMLIFLILNHQDSIKYWMP